jgi:uncharacterized iron-regulated protein
MYKALSFILLLLFFSACSTPQTGIKHKLTSTCDYYSLQKAQCQTQAQVVKALEPYKVIFIGDHHNEDNLHKKVAVLIKSLAKSGVKVHLANEWFYPEDASILARFSKGKIDEEKFQKEIHWKERLKRNKYESFSPMYQAIRETKGELHGINLCKKARKKISEQNLTAMTEQERNFNDSLDLDVYPHKELIMPFLSHCHAPKKNESLQACTQRMYRVQVAWDSKMALESYKLSKQLKENEKLLVFAGSMHIETRLGIPLRFARLSDLPSLSIIPMSEQTTTADNDTGDLILFYKPKKETENVPE